MLTTIAVSAAVLTVVTCWLVSLLRGESTARDHLLSAQTNDRLARQFRLDVHAAVEVRAGKVDAAAQDAASELVALKLNDGTQVEYRIDGHQLSRLEHSGSDLRRREGYRLSSQTQVRIDLTPNDKPTMASLLIDQRLAASQESGRLTLRIDAACGLLPRLASQEAKR